MDFYLKELPDSTVTLITCQGQVIGKFDSLDEAENLFFDDHYIRPAYMEIVTAELD